ncbi:hypothetical protein [Enhygromyxa salina]|uniref:Uncharacterized protein n=1 Tax=Enhygromyxa salina TaxID=215803 RepID=A0A2S9YNM6_9BACT|nr:hypothetical protein [Enhygromyxa salina]PRQ06688.1 hypothetical protein ENSA7_35640 [Enhygromyxa salina]
MWRLACTGSRCDRTERRASLISIEDLAAAATELRTQAHRDAYPGTGLPPTGDWAELSQPYAG